MGDHYQTIADLDTDGTSANSLASRLQEWFISRQIIVPEKSDCVLGESGGHAPGKNYTLAAEETKGLLFELKTNGVRFISGRTVFYSAGVGEPSLICSACGKRFEYNKAWSAAISEWYEGKGPGLLECENCHFRAAIADWNHDPPWAFGYLGIEFWNWPNLRAEFVNEVGSFLGHRVRVVYGKI